MVCQAGISERPLAADVAEIADTPAVLDDEYSLVPIEPLKVSSQHGFELSHTFLLQPSSLLLLFLLLWQMKLLALLLLADILLYLWDCHFHKCRSS